MGKCALGACFTLLTIITIGATLALFIFAVIVYTKIKVVSETVFIVVIVGLCVTALLFLFGIYASFCGGNCSKNLLSILYLLFSLVIGGAGVILLIYRTKLPEYFEEYVKNQDHKEIIDTIENVFKCSVEETPGTKTCQVIFKEYCEKYGAIVGGCLLGIFAFLLFGVIIAWCLMCQQGKADTSNVQPLNTQNTLNDQLNFDW